eukprot:Gb_10947 [translate_table: standard]
MAKWPVRGRTGASHPAGQDGQRGPHAVPCCGINSARGREGRAGGRGRGAWDDAPNNSHLIASLGAWDMATGTANAICRIDRMLLEFAAHLWLVLSPFFETALEAFTLQSSPKVF